MINSAQKIKSAAPIDPGVSMLLNLSYYEREECCESVSAVILKRLAGTSKNRLFKIRCWGLFWGSYASNRFLCIRTKAAMPIYHRD